VFRDSSREMRWGMPNEAVWRPPTDVYVTDENVVVVVEIAGLSAGDYSVLQSGSTLVISGERRDPAEKLGYQQMEIRHGKFRTQVQIPWPLDPTGQQAEYRDGFLKVTLPKAQVRRVPIRTIEE
jgi:HSP20 family protein